MPRVCRTPVLRLLGLTAICVAVQGYHLGVDDAAIYVPGIKRMADPALYPFGAEFFRSHARLTILPLLAGGPARLAHVPADWTIFAWYVAGVFLLLAAGWRLACACFTAERSRWGAVALLAAAMPVPVAGTALAIMDPYISARTLSTPASLFAIACYVSGSRGQALAWWGLTALVHPQMSVYTAVLLGCLAAAGRLDTAFAAGIPFLSMGLPPTGAARETLLSRSYFFVSHWAWYEWAGVFAPLALLYWFGTASLRGVRPAAHTLARTLVPFGLLFTAAGIALSASRFLEGFTRLQPMRALHLLYVILFVLLGGLAAEYVLGRHPARWLALFGTLGLSMGLLQFEAYPASRHLEWPGAGAANRWLQAFLWIRQNTPKDAVFALDPHYLARPGEDMHGFRAVAERSMLADALKDSGAVSLFPSLADEWKAEVRSAEGWRHFRLGDFERLAEEYPVTWFVVERPAPSGLACPYRNAAVAVCRLPQSISLAAASSRNQVTPRP
jgi:hypothetical protein